MIICAGSTFLLAKPPANSRDADYIVLHPQRGLLFLEIKDWKLATIKDINHDRVVLNTDRGDVTTVNPLKQARQCAYAVVNQLITDPQLRQVGNKYVGKLACPYGYGVVFANIPRAQLNRAIPLDAQELQSLYESGLHI
jgi:hypothetical protein